MPVYREKTRHEFMPICAKADSWLVIYTGTEETSAISPIVAKPLSSKPRQISGYLTMRSRLVLESSSQPSLVTRTF